MIKAAEREQVAVGTTTVTYLPDGHGYLDPAVVFPASGPDGWSQYGEFLDGDGRFAVSVGSFLIRTAGQNILVDLGLGKVEFEVPGVAAFAAGRLLESLASEGLAPADIDVVFYTHLHHDHVGWTTDLAPAPAIASGSAPTGLTFGKARHLVAAEEFKYWSGTDEVVGPNPTAVQEPLEGVVQFVTDGEQIAPGVQVLGTAGHTPGHSSLLVTDPAGADSTKVLVLGDVMHCQVQVTASSWNPIFDVDPVQSLRTRRRVLAELDDPAMILAGGHFSESVFGRVHRGWEQLG